MISLGTKNYLLSTYNLFISDDEPTGTFSKRYLKQGILIDEVYESVLDSMTSLHRSSFPKELLASMVQRISDWTNALQVMSVILETYHEVYELENYAPITQYSVDEMEEVYPMVFRQLIRPIRYTTKDMKQWVIEKCQSPVGMRDHKFIIELISELGVKVSNDQVKNRELKAYLIQQNVLEPSSIEDVFRIIYQEATPYGPMIIQGASQLSSVADWLNRHINHKQLTQWIMAFSDEELAKQANRYRKLYLLIRHYVRALRPKINRVLRKAKTQANPYQAPYTAHYFQQDIHPEKLVEAPWQQLIRIKQYERLNKQDVVTYTIRTGAQYVTKRTPRVLSEAHRKILDFAIRVKLAHHPLIEKKHLHIPEGIRYPIVTSHKQFVGHIPSGTRYHFKKKGSYSVGVTWSHDMDIDLHAQSGNQNIGWNATHKDDGLTYSGDMVGLNRKGYASEYINVSTPLTRPLILKVFVYDNREEENRYIKVFVTPHVDSDKFVDPTQAYSYIPIRVPNEYEKELITLYIEEQDDDVYVYFLRPKSTRLRIPDWSTASQEEVTYQSVIHRQVYWDEYFDQLGVVNDSDGYDLSIENVSPDDFM